MSRWVFDIETDGLLKECTRMWCMVLRNLVTCERLVFLEGDMGWQQVFNDAQLIVGHNILGFDLPALTKIYGYQLPKSVKVHDSLLLSQILDYRRFGHDGHSLAVWGEFLGRQKPEHEDWSQFSPEMLHRCKEDVEINVEVYEILLKEFKALAAKAPQIVQYIQAEHRVSEFNARAHLHGWPFDVEKALTLRDTLQGEMNQAYEALSHKLGYKCKAVDRKLSPCKTHHIYPHKEPKWTKQGYYHVHTANWFGVAPESGLDDEMLLEYPGHRMIQGPYSRIQIEPLSLDSVSDVKTFLFRNGWEPTEYNYKFEDGKRIQTSPKITEDSLEFLGGDGKLYVDFLTTRARFGILNNWIENTDANGMLHGDCMNIGTPSMRTRHEIIVNVPSADAKWGKEMRELFKCLPGWKIIGCDSAGNQARGLAHYLGDPEFIDILLNDDIHTYNAGKMTEALKMMGIEHVVERSPSKRIFYATLFGASGGKLWSYIFGGVDDKLGNKFKKNFLKAVPGFAALLEKLENIYGKTSQYGDGYIPSIAGNRIYVDSFHKLLVYLLQSCEKVTCSSAVAMTMDTLEAENIPYIPLIMMHDEEQFMVPEQYAERAGEIGAMSFREAPKLYDIQIMDGSADVGLNWYETH